MATKLLSEVQVLSCAYSFLCEGYLLPQNPTHAKQVYAYLGEVLKGTSELPDDLSDLQFENARRARLRGYQARLFKNAPDPVKPAYTRALQAWEALGTSIH